MADFAALMSAAMSKSKPQAKDSGEPKKYLKRSELEAQREASYRAEQDAVEKAKEEKLKRKREEDEQEAERAIIRDEKRRRLAEESQKRREEEDAAEDAKRRKRLGLPPLPPKAIEGSETSLPAGLEEIPDEELKEKLRALGEPITLFGETHIMRLRRHKILITPKVVLSDGPIPTTLSLLPEADMAVPSKVPAEGTEEREYLFRQLASYFTMVLIAWDRALAERPQAVKESMQGKQAETAWVQSRDNMRPLFKKFEKGDIEDGILGPVVDIVRAAQNRRYVEANDQYLQLSIGKA